VGGVDSQEGVEVTSLLGQETCPPIPLGGDCCPMNNDTFSKWFIKSTTGGPEEQLVELQGGDIFTGRWSFHRKSLLKDIAANRLLGKMLLFVVFSTAML